MTWARDLWNADPVKYHEIRDGARKTYLQLCMIPFGSRERIETDSGRAFLRDLVAEVEGRGSEEVQSEYEAEAFRLMSEAK